MADEYYSAISEKSCVPRWRKSAAAFQTILASSSNDGVRFLHFIAGRATVADWLYKVYTTMRYGKVLDWNGQKLVSFQSCFCGAEWCVWSDLVRW